MATNESIERLMALVSGDDPFGATPDDLEELWIDAIDFRFQQCRERIGVLQRLADEAGVDSITSLDDVVPLLFAHTAYKSYPEAFIDNGRWDRMNVWLNTLSTHEVSGVDVAGVADADDWIARCHAAGHYVFATSGTSGKNSFLNQSQADVDFANTATIPPGLPRDNSIPIFVLGPRKAPNRASATFTNLVSVCGRPDAVYFMTDAELRITDLSQMARMRRKIGACTATPSEISEFEESVRFRQEVADTMVVDLVDKIIAHRGEPILLVGLTPQLYRVVEVARERGIADGSFHPDTQVISGGGIKGQREIPADHVQQIMTFFGIGLDKFTQGYGMQEASSGARMNEWGRYEFPGWIVPLLLDDSGEKLQRTREGRATGRMALFDVSIDGRWGGITSGDRVVIDYDPSPAGRSVPAVVDIARYSELEGGDDKLTCAGTIDSFVRGAVGES
ncbi:hypothetical protein ACWDTD_18775 [Gordonia sp. NPDC003425]